MFENVTSNLILTSSYSNYSFLGKSSQIYYLHLPKFPLVRSNSSSMVESPFVLFRKRRQYLKTITLEIINHTWKAQKCHNILSQLTSNVPHMQLNSIRNHAFDVKSLQEKKPSITWKSDVTKTNNLPTYLCWCDGFNILRCKLFQDRRFSGVVQTKKENFKFLVAVGL